MAASAILKIRKIAISQPRFERFRQNLAWLRSSTLLTVPNVKNFKFWKSKMAAAAILKIEKSPYLGRSLSDFDEIWHTDALRPSCLSLNRTQGTSKKNRHKTETEINPVILPNLVVSGAHWVKVVDKAVTIDNLRLLCLVVNACRGPRDAHGINS